MEEQELYEDSTDEKPPSKTNQWDSSQGKKNAIFVQRTYKLFTLTNLWTYAITQSKVM